MTQEMKKPEGGFSALRVRIDRMLTRTNVDQATAKRNAEHFKVASEKHTWLQAISVANLPSSAFRVAIVLLQKHLNSKTGLCFPSLETIAEGCKLPIRTARDGLDALRRQGFIVTQKIGTHDPLFFFFAVPSRVAEIRHSEDSVPRVENSHSRVSNLRRATSGEFSTSNHGMEPQKVTMEETVVPNGPPSAVVAFAPPVDIPASPTCLPRTANVSGGREPSYFLPEKEEAIRCPSSLVDQIRRLHEIVGSDADKDVIGDLASTWAALGAMTLSDIKGRAERKLRRAS